MSSGIGVLDKALKIIDIIAEHESLTLQQLVDSTGFPRPTAHRLVRALETHGLVGREQNAYRLGVRLLALGQRAAGTGPLIQAARPVLVRLRETTSESAQLYVRDGDRRVCVAAAERLSGLRDTVPLGALLPLDAGSGGKVLLAWSEDADRFGVTQEELSRIRQRGFALSFAEREAGVASISAPILDQAGQIQAVISISGPLSRINEETGPALALQVVEGARQLQRAARLQPDEAAHG